MKTHNLNPLFIAGKLINSPYPLLKLNLLSYLLLFVLSSSFLLIFCFQNERFSINVRFSDAHFSVFTSQSSMDQPAQFITASNATSAGKSDHFGLRRPPPAGAVHGMSDEELLREASMITKIRDPSLQEVPKIAFMFLTRGPVVLAALWELFFEGHGGFYTVYVHSDPSFNETAPEGSVFHGRRIPSKEVGWGNVNMIEAERRLLASALLDSSNQRFILLSEACIPLYNFTTIYSYTINSTQNFVELYDQPGPVGRGRYAPEMGPTITIEQWRKGSQWFVIDRDLALEVVSDTYYFPIFQSFCNGSCYADEHYLPTMVHVRFVGRNSNRSLTWVDWSKGGPHPSRFIRPDVTPGFLEDLRNGKGSTCEYNGRESRVCFLFARKFTGHALSRLLRFAPKVMQFKSKHRHKHL